MTSYYDAVILYSSTISRLRQLGQNVSDGPAVAHAMRNTTVPSPLGYSIDIDVDGDRTRAYSLKQMSSDTGKFDVRFSKHHYKIDCTFGKKSIN